MKDKPRYGLTLTDCVFMASRDGINFQRQDEAFIRPEPEEPYGWVYGTAYPARGMIETPGDLPGQDPEISMYVFIGLISLPILCVTLSAVMALCRCTPVRRKSLLQQNRLSLTEVRCESILRHLQEDISILR